jgi:hypothetical protein
MTLVPNLARIAACLLALTLAGCNGTLVPLDASTNAGRQIGNVQAVPVAFTALEGAPDTIQTRFVDRLAQEALSRQLRPVEAEAARYFIRGYLSATTSEGSTTFIYVWDVFDGSRQRIQRVEDQISLARRATDPWSLADDALLGSLAAKSADDLATLIATLPEALASAPAPAPVQSALLAE